MEKILQEIDEVYQKYGYSVSVKDSLHIYEYKIGRYFGVDFVNSKSCKEFDKILNEYKSAGYAWNIKTFESTAEAELELFNSTFQTKSLKSFVSKVYGNFVKSKEQNLPTNAKYEYISSQYSLLEYSNDDIANISDNESESLVDRVDNILNRVDNKPKFIIIEAAAGYGKTCSAYELLNQINKSQDIIPLYIELSRNREARIFKHILLSEIDRQFQNTVSSELVIHEIKSGRIPLIIDGFDELLSREKSVDDAQSRDAESMLTTIVELLEGNAKIIITSRKTAIFNTDEFFQFMDNKSSSYAIARFSLEAPTIDDWISPEYSKIFKDAEYPLIEIANPVLLSYIRNLPIDELSAMVSLRSNLIDKYFSFLLARERIRQDYTFSDKDQMSVLMNLVRTMMECDVNSESKDMMQLFISEDSCEIIDNYIKLCSEVPKPTKDELVDRFSNHALLDRKDNGLIGFINEFVYGYLIGKNLIEDTFIVVPKENSRRIVDYIKADLAMLAIESYKVQTKEEKRKLFSVLDSCSGEHFNSEFYLFLDVTIGGVINRNYEIGSIYEHTYTDITFSPPAVLSKYNFFNCAFHSCKFSKNSFKNCTFSNCKYFDCEWLGEDGICVSDITNISFMGCDANNNFTDIVYEEISSERETQDLSVESVADDIMSLFFVGGIQKPMRKLRHIKDEIGRRDIKAKLFDKAISLLQKNKHLILYGDVCFMQKEGVKHYRKAIATNERN